MAVFVHSDNEFFANRGAEIIDDLLVDVAESDELEIDTLAAEDRVATAFGTDDVGHLLDDVGNIHFHVNNVNTAYKLVSIRRQYTSGYLFF